MQYKIREVHLG